MPSDATGHLLSVSQICCFRLPDAPSDVSAMCETRTVTDSPADSGLVDDHTKITDDFADFVEKMVSSPSCMLETGFEK